MRLQGKKEDLERRTELAYDIIMRMPSIAAIFLVDQQRMFLMHLLMHFLMILKQNSFENVFSTRDVNKCTIFDTLSMFNHSCSPNVIKIMHGTKMYLVSARFIRRRDELTIDYKQFRTENTAKRRRILDKIWDFNCACERCRYADEHVDDETNEITQEEIQRASSNSQNPFDGMEGKLKRRFGNRYVPWNLSIGALGIAYKDSIVAHLHRS